MRNYVSVFACALLVLASACNKDREIDLPSSEVTVLDISIASPETRTHMGASDNGERPVYWSDGDQICLNGVESNALSSIGDAATSASFTFNGVLNPPYEILYPASFYKNATTITLPDTQTWAAGSFATNTMPMAGYQTAGNAATISHLGAIVHLQVKKDAGVSASSLASVTFTGRSDEQVAGDFTIDYEHQTLEGAAAAGEGRSLTLNLTTPQSLSESTALDLFLVVPAGTYASGFQVVLTDEYNRTMTKLRSSSIELACGNLVKMPVFGFVPSSIATEFGIPNIEEEVLPPDGYNIKGRVVDSSSNPIEGVVVSDGTQCVRTMPDGTFYMESTIANVKFVHVSTPSGYMPTVSGGIPRFYKAKADITPSAGIYDFGDFVLTPVANPDRFTLLITADPQPRKNNWTLDKIAYKSLDVCQDLYQELYDVASGISGRQVYGICLGDIVHEDMSLYAQYVTALGTLGYPTYNIIGNHDNDPSAANDDAGAVSFESNFGPRNYSFNIGGIHFVMLDNLIMKANPESENKLTSFDQGLTDQIWAWLQADMAFVPTTTKIMVCAHSPMFKLLKGSERTNSAFHAGTRSDKDNGSYGYGDLFDKYDEVHAWAGHTHVGFNYIYPSNHRHKKIQVHTLARSTGELWTNEYLAAGTPRGFTVVEVDNGTITWKFHPLTRQRGAFQGVTTGYCSQGAPAYNRRDWSYNASGVAVMNGGGALTEDYQMHAYPRGAYGDNYVYVNVFLWDENWELPVWTPDGGTPVTMTRLVSADNQESLSLSSEEAKVYDAADTEFRTWYKTYANKSGGSLAGLDGYRVRELYSADGYITTIFRAPADASPSSGTVSVTDRFGNVYSRTVSW